ncbi:uncharacterized protein LOC122643596 [Telopea speciosissima]|uniref:uncharacterized protein LOC122643596 n=1 Tax=Telopea speciosissima TaxID=54955 RepID=UPI001CC54497|nr:uncharacterized protein LOC122643596 [Telopea speciosissima]
MEQFPNLQILVPEPANLDYALAWKQQDALILSLLISSLSTKVLPLIIGKDTSKALWDALHIAYGSTSSTHIMSLNLALYDLTQNPDESMVLFLQRARSIADELQAIGKTITPEDFNIHIYHGLLPDLKAIVPSLLTQKPAPSFNDRLALLQSHEVLTSFTKLAVSEVPTTTTALSTHSVNHGPASDHNPSNSHKGYPYGRGGRGCGRGGHSQTNTQWCNICHRLYHSAQNCH